MFEAQFYSEEEYYNKRSKLLESGVQFDEKSISKI